MNAFRATLCFLLLSPAGAHSQLPSKVELKSGQTTAPDGFYLSLGVGTGHFQSDNGWPFEMLGFSLSVPRKVGEASFCSCQLEIQDTWGRTLLSAPLSSTNGAPKTDLVSFNLMVQRRYTKGCKLHFMYSLGPFGAIAKEYVCPLDDRLPK
jgi:hypothetical protein